MNERQPSGIVTSPAQASEATATHYASHGEQGAAYDAFTSPDPRATGHYGVQHANGAFDTGVFATNGSGTAAYATGALFDGTQDNGQGATATYAPAPGHGMPDQGQFNTSAYDTGTYDTGMYDTTAYGTHPYDTGAYAGHDVSGTHHTGTYAAPAYDTGVYDTGAYDTTSWPGGYPHLSAVPPQSTGADATGHGGGGTWAQPGGGGETAPFGLTQQWEWATRAAETGTFDASTFTSGPYADDAFDTGAYDATRWNAHDGGTTTAGANAEHPAHAGEFEGRTAERFDPRAEMFDQRSEPFDPQPARPGTHAPTVHAAAVHAVHAPAGEPQAAGETPQTTRHPSSEGELESTGEMRAVPALLDDQEEITPAASASRSEGRGAGAGRSRRRMPVKRSALLTVAVPSVCVMGVAGIAAASVGGLHDDSGSTGTTATASDAHAVRPSAANNKLDTQLASLSAGADDFADRASRTQERIDLKAEQAAEKKKAAEAAARKERLRPKFVLPVTQKGLSAYFGQAGVNWMSVHTGIDFPVSYGTTVMSATDGTVRTQWNSAYGNMAIVTAKDGTETWYCHLSSYRVASGTTVQAGQPIAYSGNSGNSTGPHLHFEVRPAGGAAIDPLPWLRSHGLDPT